jgi:AcrR family transcriptional regulator
MPRPRFENVDADKRARLIEAAMKEFATHGYEQASMNRIIETAGFSKGSFYYYFDDKADLAATTLIAAAEELGAGKEDFRSVRTAAEFWAEMRRLSHERLRQLVSNRTHYECLIRLSNAMIQEVAVAQRVMPSFEEGRRRMGGFLEQGVRVGALRTDLPVGTIIMLAEAAKMTAYKAMFPGDRVPSEAELEAFTDLVLDLAKRIGAPGEMQKKG